MTASRAQQKQYAPSEHVIRRVGLWRVVKATRGFNLQQYYARRWVTRSFKADRDAALELLNTKRVR